MGVTSGVMRQCLEGFKVGCWEKDMFNRIQSAMNNGCDYTNTNALGPIRTLKLSVLGQYSTRMGEPQESPRVASLLFVEIQSCSWKNIYLFIYVETTFGLRRPQEMEWEC